MRVLETRIGERDDVICLDVVMPHQNKAAPKIAEAPNGDSDDDASTAAAGSGQRHQIHRLKMLVRAMGLAHRYSTLSTLLLCKTPFRASSPSRAPPLPTAPLNPAFGAFGPFPLCPYSLASSEIALARLLLTTASTRQLGARIFLGGCGCQPTTRGGRGAARGGEKRKRGGDKKKDEGAPGQSP